MNEKEFVASRRAEWDRLLNLIERAETRLTALDGSEIREFGRLYRRAARDLAVVRTRSPNLAMRRFLNDLVSRGHCILYQHPRRSFLVGLARGIEETCQAVRRRALFIAAAILVFALSAVFARQVISREPDMVTEFLPAGFEDALDAWKEEFEGRDEEEALEATGYYMMNNTIATLYAVGGGMSFGVITVYSLFTNGALMGAFASELADAGRLRHFLVGVAPHGVTELGGLFIGSAAGFLLGWALVAPGRRTRAQSVRACSRDATLLILLAVGMIWIAAPIEGWISFEPGVPDGLKLGIAGVTLVGWLALFTLVGKNSGPQTS